MDLTPEHLVQPAAPAAGSYLRPARVREIDRAIAIDDDACRAYLELSPDFDVALPHDHPFIVAETARWREAAENARLLFACASDDEPVGFAALGLLDGLPYLAQVSVKRAWMRRGLGRALVASAIRWSARGGALWLTTYAEVPWNRPWYERLGFRAVAEPGCGSELQAVLRAERAALPRAEERVAMVYRHGGG